MLKDRLDAALSVLVWRKVSLLSARGWNKMVFQVPSNQKQSVIV